MTKIDELLDVYDARGNYLSTRPRSSVHRDGDWHKTIHCWVIFEDPQGEGTIILQKRSLHQDAWPGRFDITAAGHLLTGETVLDGLRELYEEIGLRPDPGSILDLGVRVCVDEFSPGMRNYEFQHVFFILESQPLSSYRLQRDEVDGLVAVPIQALMGLLNGRCPTIVTKGLCWQGAVLVPCNFRISGSDFVPNLDNYQLKVLQHAKRALAGDRELLI